MNKKNVFKLAMFFIANIFFIVAIKAQDQVINADFENWETVATNEQEPVQWNSFRTNGGSMATLARAKQVDISPVVRPGSQGERSAVIWTRSVLVALANGNLTTGQIQAGNMTPSNLANHNKTIRDNANFNMPFTATPDSLTVWTKYVPKNTTSQARIAAIIHGDADYRDPNNNSDGIEDFVVGKAILNYPATEDKGWQRLSIPFDYNFASDDPRYILITFTANMTPGGGTANDSVYIDDMQMIYKPALAAENTSDKTIFKAGDGIEISYTITGTMSPYNLNADANVVRLELSDAEGSFDNPTVLDEVTTDESGEFTATLPAEMTVGDGYKLRVVTTNYPMISEAIGIEIYEPDTTSPVVGEVAAQAADNNDNNCIFTIPNIETLVRAVSSDNVTAQADLIIEQNPVAGTTITENTTVNVRVSDAAGNIATTTVEVNLPEMPTLTFQPIEALCENAAPIALVASNSASLPGSFIGTGVSGTMFDSSLAGAGTHAITYKIAPYGCEMVIQQTVTVNQNPAAPIVVTPVTYVVDDVATPLTATGNNLLWYDDNSTPTALAEAPTPLTTAVTDSRSYWVSQTVNACESQRAEIAVEVQPKSSINTLTADDIRIYPNPVKDELKIESGAYQLDNATIFDLSGKKLATFSLQSSNKINVSSYESGTYVIVVATKDGSSYRQLFVKK